MAIVRGGRIGVAGPERPIDATGVIFGDQPGRHPAKAGGRRRQAERRSDASFRVPVIHNATAGEIIAAGRSGKVTVEGNGDRVPATVVAVRRNGGRTKALITM